MGNGTTHTRTSMGGGLSGAALLAISALAATLLATALGIALCTNPAEAANGCGPGFFRTLAGQCFPNERFIGPFGGVRAPPPCPPGYLRAPDRPVCYPVRRY